MVGAFRSASGSFASILRYLRYVRYPAHLEPFQFDVVNFGIGVIQAPESEPPIMRYERADFEWTAISSQDGFEPATSAVAQRAKAAGVIAVLAPTDLNAAPCWSLDR